MFPRFVMFVSDHMMFIVVALLAWSQYKYCQLQQKLTECKKEITRNETAAQNPDAHALPAITGNGQWPQLGDKEILEGGSSVWCGGSSNTDRMCRFLNLCFSQKHKEFVFLNGPQSASHGIPLNPFDPALVDLSSVSNHNTQYFTYIHLPVDYVLRNTQSVGLNRGNHLLMNRFHPGNIMHVFHDDLLPLFDTMLQTGLMTKQDLRTYARLVFLDGHPPGEFMNLYISLFGHQPIFLGDFEDREDGFMCFQEAHVGLANTTVWYQYGFNRPQGPILNALISASKVKLFTSFVHSRLGTSKCSEPEDYAVIIKRESTRLILNELDLVLKTVHSTGMRVVTAGLDDFSVRDLIELISCTKALIGMHGSLLVLSMFLPVGSVLLELFPYAINPDHYTPYRTIVQLPGMGVTYRSWRNLNPDQSVPHPDALPAHGGIKHLTVVEQQRILSSTEVPRHLCCSDPEWLFRIYQDTIVDIPSVVGLLSNALADCEPSIKDGPPVPFFPSKVGNIKCIRKTWLRLSWLRPWNIEHISPSKVNYELWVQEQGMDEYEAFIVRTNEFVISEGLNDTQIYRIWIRCLIGNAVGPFTTAFC